MNLWYLAMIGTTDKMRSLHTKISQKHEINFLHKLEFWQD